MGAIKVARRTEGTVGTTCVYWLAGRCNRNPCRFLHRETPSRFAPYCNAKDAYPYQRKLHSSRDKTPTYKSKRVYVRNSDDRRDGACVTETHSSSEKISNTDLVSKSGDGGDGPSATETHSSFEKISKTDLVSKSGDGGDGPSATETHSSSEKISNTDLVSKGGDGEDGPSATEVSHKPSQKLSESVNCLYGDRLSTLAKLQGHKKVITGIALPAGSDKLFSGSIDGTVRIWDCHTGQCANVLNLDSEATSLISEGPWVYVGVRNAVKAWNIQTGSEFTLNGPKGQVLAMIVGNDTLFAGAEDGAISAWRISSEAISPFQLAESLNGHTKAVVCLTVGRNELYSGSIDHSIMVWDLDTLECKMTLNGHTDVVTSLICCGNALLSSSLDCTIKVWVATEEGTLKVIHTHIEENGVIALCEMTDAEDKHILFSSCRDNSVRLYDLPSFSGMGRLFANKEVRSLEIGPGGLIFTGDGTGLLTVWKWLQVPKESHPVEKCP